jgi:hypothetical protein
MTAKKKISDIEKGALVAAGFGIAMVKLINLHGEDMARDVILSAGFTIEHFEDAPMEPDEIAILKKALAQ